MNSTVSVSTVAGAPAVAATVIKRRSAASGTPKAFTMDEVPVQQDESRSQGVAGQGDQVISEAEKQYFEGLFPAAADAIRTYSPYQKSGMARTAAIGTLVDVKG